MKCLPCPDCEIQEDIPSAHRLIMQVLNLLVSLITNNMEKEASDNYRRLLNHKDITVQEGMEASRRARKAIDMILTTIPTTANTVLDHLGEAVPFENHVSQCYGRVYGLLTSHFLDGTRCSGQIVEIRSFTA